MRHLLILLSLVFAHDAFAQEEHEAIEKIMQEQQVCWNAGDIDCFMESYWKSDELQFVSKSKVTYGWQATKDNYHKAYPSKEAMGKLTFGIVSHQQLADDTILTVGTWKLDLEGKDSVGGHFTLIWKEFDGVWKIILDHTS